MPIDNYEVAQEAKSTNELIADIRTLINSGIEKQNIQKIAQLFGMLPEDVRPMVRQYIREYVREEGGQQINSDFLHAIYTVSMSDTLAKEGEIRDFTLATLLSVLSLHEQQVYFTELKEIYKVLLKQLPGSLEKFFSERENRSYAPLQEKINQQIQQMLNNQACAPIIESTATYEYCFVLGTRPLIYVCNVTKVDHHLSSRNSISTVHIFRPQVRICVTPQKVDKYGFNEAGVLVTCEPLTNPPK